MGVRPEVNASWPLARGQLDDLIATLEVGFVKLAECLVAPGWRLAFSGIDTPSIHYGIRGSGCIVLNDHAPITLAPHTIAILPKNTPFSLEPPRAADPAVPTRTVKGEIETAAPGTIKRVVAGSEEPQVTLICGYFRALYGQSIGIFDGLRSPIVEQFSPGDRIDQKLEEARDELIAQEVGTGSMTAGLLKLVLIRLLRRSMISQELWTERFALLRDSLISRAFADMAASPSSPHTVHSLSQAAGLSRSAFMDRFVRAFGDSPMAVLRQLRMRHAAALLTTRVLSLDQVARSAGYGSRSGFSRAFQRAYGMDPTEYRRQHEVDEGQGLQAPD